MIVIYASLHHKLTGISHNETYFTPLHAILSVYDAMDISTVGLRESTLYDIIPVIENAANAGVTVNSTTISVDCSPTRMTMNEKTSP